jgi:hypothetical protein
MAANRWQYEVQTIVSSGFLRQRLDPNELQKILNERGISGWELVQILPPQPAKISITYMLVFKREG